ncbi:MAG: undecaprenyl-diphosphate phosphatase [Chitinivibrionales bacterium]
MDLVKSVLLGIIQGLTEFLPVSSSGHLVIFGHFLDFKRPDTSFEVILHTGSLVAVLIYFRKDILTLMKSLLHIRSEEYRKSHFTILYLMCATIATAVVGILLEDFFEKLFQAPVYAGLFLVVNGFILILSDKSGKERFNIDEIGIPRSIIIGLGQSLAILPGISRSGTTIAVSIAGGLKRSDAARFSFLLSVPAIAGAAVLKLDEIKALNLGDGLTYLAGAAAAFVSGYLVISLLITMIRKQKLKYFAFYCWALAAVSLTILGLQ